LSCIILYNTTLIKGEKRMRVVLAFMTLILLSAADVFAGMPAQRIISVPTLGEWGMIAVFVVLGITGLITVRKHLATNSDK
jgi:hypothetical protein